MSQPLALALTLMIEAVAVALVTVRWRPPGVGRWVLTALCASLLTHPVAWWAHGALPLALWPRALVIEAAVVAVEAGIYRGLVPASTARALAASLMANGASFGVGVLLTA